MNTRFARALALLTLAAVGTAACTPAEDTRAQGPQATVSAGTEASPETTEGASPSTSPGDEEDGVTPVTATNPFDDADEIVTIAIKDPATLDPLLIGDPGSALVARQLYEGLTRWDPERREVVGALARSWKTNKKGTVYTFKLKPDATFHDGTPVTADDFIFAFDRIAERKNASDLAYVLQRVKGFTAVNQIGKSQHLEGLRAPDPTTLVIELTEPDQDFPAVLTHPGLVPLSASAVNNANEFLRNPIGNGPFQMAQPWDVGGDIYLEAFAGAPRQPDIDGLHLVPYDEAATSWLDFLEGELDISEVPAGQIEDAGERYGERNFQPLMNGYAYGFNLTSKGLDDPKLRKAVNFSIDRGTIGKVVYNGIMEPARGIVPPGVPGFEKDICEKLCSFEPKIAKRLIKKVPAGKRKLTIQFPDETPHDEVAKLMKRNLTKTGFEVKLDGLSFNKFFDLLQTGAHSTYRLTWIAEFPSPDAYLAPLFESDSPDNHSGFSSKKVDALLEKARSQPKETKRLRLYRRVEKLILKEVPIVPIGYFTSHWAAQPEIKGLRVDSTGGFDAVTLTVTEESPDDEEE
ncbi:MAG: peptide ABC transporter substrate-binding protein [Actinomycetota bacterium]|nr:peptide ABC transporter substrate-binding protein [Actinomycetota bacterium]